MQLLEELEGRCISPCVRGFEEFAAFSADGRVDKLSFSVEEYCCNGRGWDGVTGKEADFGGEAAVD